MTCCSPVLGIGSDFGFQVIDDFDGVSPDLHATRTIWSIQGKYRGCFFHACGGHGCYKPVSRFNSHNLCKFADLLQVACTVENTVAVATLKRLVGCMTVFDIRCNEG